MFCRNCGNQAEEGATFCAECGAALVTAPDAAQAEPQQPAEEAAQPKKKLNGFAIAGFILSLFPIISVIGLVLSIVGVIMSRKWHSLKGLSIAGIVFGAIWTFVLIVALIAVCALPFLGFWAIFEAFRQFFAGELYTVTYTAAALFGF